MSSVDGLQYWALYEYKKDREEDLALCPGDLLMVNRAGLACMDYKEGDERNPQGWLNGFNECTKEWGDFPGTYVEYLGPVRIVATMPKSRPRPLPPAPTETSSSHLWGPPGQIEFVDQLNLPEQALLVVKRLIEALEKEGLDNEALYRSPPTSFCDPQLKQILLKDLASVELDRFDGQTLAEVLRCYLQELPCPVIHSATYSELLYVIQETQTPEECGQQIKVILESACLPQWHRLLLQHLTRHFCKLCQNGSRNHLTPRVLGEALSEVLFKPSPSSMEVNPEHRVKIIEALIVVGGVSEIQAAPDSCCQIGLG
ncbi:phosphatidylinositol 3-kinase regulatory subunit alpha-like isoform X1 [Rhineura floridana]|uniref:phosphatidylinositol 3-kinase regulatory subunit alpha-like isoform X1 n=1 Tax=Rhineura floridana TaxID=261503 RepID=UPI002AC87D13|nr:phosphatidylinositol 3-kinase regulatory subunit alpha-like isoform X1 [Rhineura floridana]XP_061488838.1 phosphatidylinositol 3-kinase regulatory subunit alpha-like isoform X1 [Rhineura floridana]XP_061488839.1 phosphatidylinositol 3-kinase regulatory subunit alpha-like isoform X1 [Rhineura floridana]XP_061488841.1 phosphatidylinositol 3-kinase regulatory subunit alpha-like isoform X1 [Rhineura floridana]